MLQIKNLTKIYKPKKGQPVKALDGVTLTFPTYIGAMVIAAVIRNFCDLRNRTGPGGYLEPVEQFRPGCHPDYD